ncbi:MAG: hypothetical protein V3T83_03520 [Acidobacteriota bacterium]
MGVAMMLEAEQVVQMGEDLGLDRIGIAPVKSLKRHLPPDQDPAGIAAHLKTVVVTVRKSLAGISASRHAGTRQFWGGRLIKQLDESSLRLAVQLEKLGSASFPLSSLMVDFGARDGRDLCPAGQGSPLLRAAAVQAGLGTLGLNGMLLTPEFGPRVYLGGVLTEADVPPGRPLQEELCPGLEECGLCAAACPADAIVRRAKRGTALSSYRRLDSDACVQTSQPLGLSRFKQHLDEVYRLKHDPEQMWPLAGGRVTGALWQEMIMVKEGVFTGCSTCLDVCPVGQGASPQSSQMAGRLKKHLIRGSRVEVEWLGGATGEGA